ncbi:MAG: MFS transporter [Oscillospiraceae bacterium]|nr:MFS transporter [Oscillospiraceae bacterium]
MKNKLEKFRFWFIVWGMGLAGQLCWNMENQWFNTFVYAKISGNVSIVTWMVIVSAIVTTLSTFIFGTLSDRMGKRKIYVSLGYIIWGAATILFGLTEYARDSGIGALVALSGALVVLTDAIMSFFGSMGCDSGYNVWLNDHTNEENQGQVGAALAVLPIIGTVVGTVVGGILINVGNPTVGTNAYDPSQDNYQLLFWAMGIFVIVIGIISLFIMKDKEGITPNREGTFFQQLTSVFQFSSLKKNNNLKELLLACAVVCTFFIPFNFYFTHLGNWLIYDIGLTTGNMGLVEGIALLLAALVTIPFASLINNNKVPAVALAATLANAVGLILIFLFVKSPEDVDVNVLFCAKNIPLFICVFLVGSGYVLITQSGMIWVRGLFPEESRGQLEGVRVMAFTLIPMLIGTLIGNYIIKHTPQPTPIYDVYGHIIDVPQENLFLIAGILVLLTLIPLYFAAKEYKKRIGK